VLDARLTCPGPVRYGRGARQLGAYEHRAWPGCVVTALRDVPRVRRLQHRVLDEHRAGAPHEVGVAADPAAGDEPLALQAQGVLVAAQVHAFERYPLVVAPERLRLRA